MEFSGLSVDLALRSLGQIVPLIVIALVGIVVLEFGVYNLLTRVFKVQNALAYTLLSPAAVALVLFMIYPLLFNILLAFSNLKRSTFVCYSPVAQGTCKLDHLYGVDYAISNFTSVFVATDSEGNVTGWGPLLQTENSTFPVLFARTVVWTGVNVVFHLSLGMALALIMNQKLRFRGLYRSFIVIPWAIPGIIVFLTWKQEFHAQYGFVNQMLIALGVQNPPQWLSDPNWALVAVIFVNIWLGVPFYMVMLLGGLQSISLDYYEAASMDGANSFQRFRFVTLPLLNPILIPALTLDVIWTFNKLDLIIAMTLGGPQEGTNILVSGLYNAAFGSAATQQLGFASAFSIVIFAILFVFVVVWMTTSGGLKEIYER
jgi:arabinogalactan oligomer/maltooligosaccharide transport system permease protein